MKQILVLILCTLFSLSAFCQNEDDGGNYEAQWVDQMQNEVEAFVQEKFNTAGEAFDQKEYQQSLDALKEIQEIAPEDPWLMINVAGCLIELQRYDEAEAMLNKAKKKEPQATYILNNFGVMYSKQGKHSLAMSQYQKAIQIDPKNYSAYNNMASAALRVDDLDNAAKYITMALKREKQSVTLLDNAGKIAMQREQYDEAERYLKKAVKKAPKFFRPYLSLADLERLRENYTKAFDYIDQAMELEPDRAEPFASSGMLHLRMEQYEKAKKDLEKAISLQRNNNYARLYLGRTYGKLGEIPKAEEALKLVLKDDDYRDAAQIELAQLYNDAGQYPKALSSIDTYLKIKPKNAEGWRLKGLILSNMGNEREAQRAYTQATSLDSGDAVSYINQAVMFFNKQDFNGVLRVAQQAENNKIKDPKISNMKVVALINLQKASDIPKAIKEAEKAGVAPSTIAQFNGQYQMTVEGDYEAAIAFFDEAIKKDGKNGLAYYYRAFCYANLGDIAKAKADASTGKRVGDEQAKASCQNLLDQLK